MKDKKENIKDETYKYLKSMNRESNSDALIKEAFAVLLCMISVFIFYMTLVIMILVAYKTRF